MSKRRPTNFHLDTEVNNWLVSFYLAAGKPVVKARHLLNNTSLQAPDDSLQIAQLIPIEEWPAFARSLYRHHEENPPQGRLFS